ncbi:MAG: PA2169 family four-helix-bundle protein [Planctomycetaceae bacterium]
MIATKTLTSSTLADGTAENLQRLIQDNVESANGFKEAAAVIENAALAHLFLEFARQRSVQAEELRTYVEFSEEEPEDRCALTGLFHQLWLDLKHLLSGDDADAVLAEVERGEQYLKEEYQAALRHTFDSSMGSVLFRHYHRVAGALDRIQCFRAARRS